MSDTDEEEATEPAVELGSQTPVEGVPLAQLAARYTWPIEKSEILDRHGDTEIRTADGPMPLADALDPVDDTYFASQRHFIDAVTSALPSGPVPTAE